MRTPPEKAEVWRLWCEFVGAAVGLVGLAGGIWLAPGWFAVAALGFFVALSMAGVQVQMAYARTRAARDAERHASRDSTH